MSSTVNFFAAEMKRVSLPRKACFILACLFILFASGHSASAYETCEACVSACFNEAHQPLETCCSICGGCCGGVPTCASIGACGGNVPDCYCCGLTACGTWPSCTACSCAAGYYGNGVTCTPCPNINAANGWNPSTIVGTSAAGATLITDCYIPGGTAGISDGTGTFTASGNCSYN